jgi:tetratricopeptide (TPR) repeat protein
MSHTFNQALNLHRQGDLDRAELLYRQVLDESPDHPDATHLLGVVAHQRGQYGRAVTLIRRAISLVAPTDAGTFYCNLAEACRMAGDVKGSVEAGRKAVALVPHSADAYNHLGLALQMQGSFEEAEAAFKDALELRPDFALAHNNLGGVYREMEKADEAIAQYREAVRLAPNLPLALSNLGQSLLEKGEKEEAVKYCKQAVALAPNFPEGLSNLGNALRAQENLKDAKDCYRIALQLRPNVAMIHGNLGQALQQEGNLDEAIKCYERAIALDSKSSRFESYLASALAEQENHTAAVEHYRKALSLKPDFAEAHNGLGQVLQEQGQFKNAIACFEEALRLKPDCADACSNLGGVWAELGDMDKADHFYREAIRFDPDYAGAYAVLATHHRDKLPDEDVKVMHDFLAREHLTDWKRATLHHGLAHYYDAKKDYAAAAEHAARGNQYRKEIWERQGKSYNRDDHTAFVSFLMKQFQPPFFEKVKGWGLDTEVPVFIVGMPRSGTTLLEQILGSHPRVFGAGELSVTKETFDKLPKWLDMQAAPSACVPSLTREVVQQAGSEHLAYLKSLSDADRVVDKMPDNYLWLGYISAIFPKAKIIYSKRDLHDIAVSCWITNFKQIRWSCTQEDIAGRIQNHVRIMEHWKKVLPIPVLEVEYEQTVEDLEGVARRMIDFCGLEWDPACLAFHQSKRTVRTASLSQVRQPVYKKSVQRWKNYEEPLKTLFTIIDG